MSGELISDTQPVARKTHLCDYCERKIRPGETYRRQYIRGDDGPYTFKVCAHCDVLYDWIVAHDQLAVDPDYGLDISFWLQDENDPRWPLFAAGWHGDDGQLVPLREAERT